MTTVTVGTTINKTTGQGVLAVRNPARKGIIVQAPATSDIYISFCGDDSVDTTKGFLISAGTAPIFFASDSRAPGPVYAVVAASTATVKVEEVLV